MEEVAGPKTDSIKAIPLRFSLGFQRQQADFGTTQFLLFFPSCASVALARSSHIVVLMNELFRCLFYVPPWGVESGVRTIRDNTISSFFSASAWQPQLSELAYFFCGNTPRTWAESRTQMMSLEAFDSGMSCVGCNKKQGPSLGQCINAILAQTPPSQHALWETWIKTLHTVDGPILMSKGFMRGHFNMDVATNSTSES